METYPKEERTKEETLEGRKDAEAVNEFLDEMDVYYPSPEK